METFIHSLEDGPATSHLRIVDTPVTQSEGACIATEFAVTTHKTVCFNLLRRHQMLRIHNAGTSVCREHDKGVVFRNGLMEKPVGNMLVQRNRATTDKEGSI